MSSKNKRAKCESCYIWIVWSNISESPCPLTKDCKSAIGGVRGYKTVTTNGKKLANVGDQFVIKVSEAIPTDDGCLYKIEGFNALIFDDNGIKKLTKHEPWIGEQKAYEQGKNDTINKLMEGMEKYGKSKEN